MLHQTQPLSYYILISLAPFHDRIPASNFFKYWLHVLVLHSFRPIIETLEVAVNSSQSGDSVDGIYESWDSFGNQADLDALRDVGLNVLSTLFFLGLCQSESSELAKNDYVRLHPHLPAMLRNQIALREDQPSKVLRSLQTAHWKFYERRCRKVMSEYIQQKDRVVSPVVIVSADLERQNIQQALRSFLEHRNFALINSNLPYWRQTALLTLNNDRDISPWMQLLEQMSSRYALVHTLDEWQNQAVGNEFKYAFIQRIFILAATQLHLMQLNGGYSRITSDNVKEQAVSSANSLSEGITRSPALKAAEMVMLMHHVDFSLEVEMASKESRDELCRLLETEIPGLGQSDELRVRLRKDILAARLLTESIWVYGRLSQAVLSRVESLQLTIPDMVNVPGMQKFAPSWDAVIGQQYRMLQPSARLRRRLTTNGWHLSRGWQKI